MYSPSRFSSDTIVARSFNYLVGPAAAAAVIALGVRE
jgi:hypothetical protein